VYVDAEDHLEVGMTTLSIIVSLGFVDQKNLGDVSLGDEFDHMAPAAKADADAELVIVDRVWPARWPRVKEALASMLDRVAYVAPRRTELLQRGYRAVSAMRNSGAMCSNGELLAFVDDFMSLDPSAIEAMCKLWKEERRVLCPVYMPVMEPADDGLQVFSGHNPGIYVCSREDFAALNGYDEHFDGAYGEEDTDFEDRLDRVLWLRGQNGALRLRRRGVMFRKTEHANGPHPEALDKPWPYEADLPNYLRCNRAFFQYVSHPRKERNLTAANGKLEPEEIEKLMTKQCVPDCGICKRHDRKLQVESYATFPPDERVGERVMVSGTRPAGSYDPWGDGTEMPWDRG
jgi:hypothetical protein